MECLNNSFTFYDYDDTSFKATTDHRARKTILVVNTKEENEKNKE